MSTSTYFKSSSGFDANGQKVLNLADATDPTDAMNLRTFTSNNTIPTYVTTRSYPVDFIVEYIGQLWKCVAAATSGPFDNTKWTAIKGTENWLRITATYISVSMDSLLVDTSANPISIGLPANPKSGDYVRIRDAGNASTNNITVLRNGSTIANLSADYVLNESGMEVTLVYLNATWQINIRRVNRVKFISASVTVDANQLYILNVVANATVTLPQSPIVGDMVSLSDRNGIAGTYSITVAGGVKQIDGSSTFSFAQKKATYQFTYNGSSWVSYMLAGNALVADKNLTDLFDIPQSRINLGLGSAALQTMGTGSTQIRTNGQNDTVYQPLDQTLTALAALITATDKLIYATGLDTFSTTDFPAQARTLLAATTQAAQQLAMGLGSAAVQTMGTATGQIRTNGQNDTVYQPLDQTLTAFAALVTATDRLIYATGVDTFSQTAFTSAARTLLAAATQAAQQTALGLGTSAVLNVGTSTGNVMQVGAFGLGSDGTVLMSNLDDSTVKAGFYTVDTTTTGTKPLTFSNLSILTGSLIVGKPSSNVVTQILINGTGQYMFSRGWNGTSWSTWNEYHTQTNMYPAWTNATYQNSWVDSDAVNNNSSGYRREGNRVWLRGLTKNATASPTVIFTLPAGFRPLKNKFIASSLGSGPIIYLTINTDGTILPSVYPTTNNPITFDGVSFELD